MIKLTITICSGMADAISVESDADFPTDDEKQMASMICDATGEVADAARRKLKDGARLDVQAFRFPQTAP